MFTSKNLILNYLQKYQNHIFNAEWLILRNLQRCLEVRTNCPLGLWKSSPSTPPPHPHKESGVVPIFWPQLKGLLHKTQVRRAKYKNQIGDEVYCRVGQKGFYLRIYIYKYARTVQYVCAIFKLLMLFYKFKWVRFF
jgi:hypothetical protein